MASKKVLIDAFFDQFITFVSELSDMYPDDTGFPTFRTTLKLMKMTYPSLVIKYVVDSTSQFMDKLLACDEAFFMDMDFSMVFTDVDVNIFTKLKSYIETMSPKSKESVWKYIQNVARLAQAIQSAK